MPQVEVGYLYSIESVEQQAVKIGFSVNPQSRLASLRSGNIGTLRIRDMLPCTSDVEEQLHRILKPHRIAREWYPDDFLTEMVFDVLRDQMLDRAMENLPPEADLDEAVNQQTARITDLREVRQAVREFYAEETADVA